jgi:hypothetical protein
VPFQDSINAGFPGEIIAGIRALCCRSPARLADGLGPESAPESLLRFPRPGSGRSFARPRPKWVPRTRPSARFRRSLRQYRKPQLAGLSNRVLFITLKNLTV